MFLYIKKSERIEAFSIRKETRGFIHEECFDTHIRKSVLYPGGEIGRRTSLKRKKEKHLVVSSNLIPGTTLL